MLHKKIHAHAKKHAQRAHAHVQDHGHKWLWLLSAVFAIILVYPYFSNAESILQECSNGATNFSECDICEEGFHLNEDDQCVPNPQQPIIPVTCNDEEANNFEEQGECTYDDEEDEENNEEEDENNEDEEENQQIPPTPTCNVSISSPTSGNILGANLDIQRTSTGTCNTDQNIAIQLRDHNQQWITLGTGLLEDEEATFSTTGLASTGFYTITGTHLSGSLRQITNDSGVVIDSGTYTQDTPYIVYTGAYTGLYTNFATGYIVKLLSNSQNTLAQSSGTFTIDNQKPTLSNLSMSFSNAVSGAVGRPSIGTISLSGSELLTGVSFTILGTNVAPNTTTQNGNTYTFTVPLANVAATGAITLTAHVQDLAGNQASIYGTSAIIFNNHLPKISNLAFTGGSGSVGLSWNTDVSTKFNFSYTKSGTSNTVHHTGSTYGTAHTHTMQNTQTANTYLFTMTISDILGNSRSLSGDIAISATGFISVGFNQNVGDILQLSQQAETNLYLQILQAEVAKFQECKAALTFTNQNIPVGNKTVPLQIPNINKTLTKQTMTAFLLLFTNKVKLRTDLSQAELTDIGSIVNNFLVVLKLTDDDNNACQQSMSNYYIGVFENMMSTMNFF